MLRLYDATDAALFAVHMRSSTAIAENIASVHERIARATNRAGRSRADITLMAVTKTQPVDNIIAAYEAGIRSFGENRVQEFASKSDPLGKLSDAQFALIGRLQSNKAGKAVELFAAIHSVDSLRLAERISMLVERARRPAMPIAIEINTGDAAKAGLSPDSPELEQLLHAAERLPGISIRGLMTIPSLTEDPEGARPYFQQLRELRDRISRRKLPGIQMDLLSMGMSHDFEVAIEEGSTCVRVGTAIFGKRG
jgi:PLP dependent protein